MLQEVYQSDKSTPKGDLLLVFVLLALFVFARYIAVFLRSLPMGGVLQLLLFAGLMAFVYYIYKTRLISYRYTLTYEALDPDKSEMFGEDVANPYPLGSLLIERMSGSRGKPLELILPQEYEALLAPDEKAPLAQSEKRKALNMTSQSKKRACRLLFKRDQESFCAYFSPSSEMAARMKEMIKDLHQA